MPDTTVSIRVRYAETDQMGVVYHANFFVWFEVARTELLRRLGWSYREMEQIGVALPVIEAQCAYRHPARYDDELDVHTEGVLVSPIRVAFDYQVRLSGGGIVTATGRTLHAAVNAAGKPCRLPDRVRSLLGGVGPEEGQSRP